MNMPAGKFKAQCLKLMDDVQKFHQEIIVTKHGKPVARLVPIQAGQKKVAFGFLRGLMTVHGDLMAPTGEPWNVDA